MRLRIKSIDKKFILQEKKLFGWVTLPTFYHFSNYFSIKYMKQYIVVYDKLVDARNQKTLYDAAFNCKE